MMKKIKQWLVEDWWLKIVSLGLAFLIWFIVVQANNPTDSKSFTNVKVNLVNTEIFEENSQVYKVLDRSDTVNVVVRAPKSVLSTLKVSDIIAEADVSNMDKDKGEIKITYSVYGNNSVESVKGDKEFVQIELEAKERKYIRLETHCTGTPSEGYMVGNMKTDQNLIEISGPKSAIDRVVSAAVTIDVTNATTLLSANVEIVLYDKFGYEITDTSITKQIDYAHVEVEILEVKTVTIGGSKIGSPADGYLFTGVVRFSPSSIKIAGNPADLVGITRINVLETIDITGATENIVTTVDLNKYLPHGTIFADPDFDGTVTATAFVEPIAYKDFEIDSSNVIFNHLPEKAYATITYPSDKIVVSLSGLQSELDKVNPESIVATIDFEKWMIANNLDEIKEDTYQIVLDVYCSGVSSSKDIVVSVRVDYEE